MDLRINKRIPLNKFHIIKFSLHFSIFFMPYLIYSENILLKNGQTLKGKITDQNSINIFIKREDGSILIISKTQILKVIYHDASTEEMEKIRLAEQQKLMDKRKQEEEKHKLDQKVEILGEQNKGSQTKGILYDYKIPSKFLENSDNKYSYLWRSALIPGWGQYYKNQKTNSAFFFLSFLVSAGALFNYDSKYHSTKSDLNSQESYFPFSTGGITDLFFYNEIQNTRQELHTNGRIASNLSVVMLTIYLLNLFDAYNWKSSEISSKRSSLDSKSETGISFHQTIIGDRKENQFLLQYQWRF